MVQIDGSETPELAIPIAVALAQQRELPICLVRIVDGADLPDLPQMGKPDPVATEIEAAGARAAEYLHHVSARLREQDATIETEVRRGRAGDQLLAATKAGDLTVMSAGGHEEPGGG